MDKSICKSHRHYSDPKLEIPNISCLSLVDYLESQSYSIQAAIINYHRLDSL